MLPHKDIYKFEGVMKDQASNKENTIELKQFIPRGAIVENSVDVYALIVYTGVETKLVLNQGKY